MANKRVIIAQDKGLVEAHKERATEYAERANRIVSACNTLQMAVSEAKAREYTTHTLDSAMLNDYITKELKATPADTPTSEVEKAAKEKFYAATIYFPAKPNVQSVSNGQFVKYDAEKRAFIVDDAAIEDACTEYLKDEDRGAYDLHQQICELLTKFFNGGIDSIADMQQYFQIAEDGNIIPCFNGTYPPSRNDEE